MQGLESHHVNLLTKEWEKREKERENLVHEKLSEIFSVEKELKQALEVELVSKELNHLAAILHVYSEGWNFMK